MTSFDDYLKTIKPIDGFSVIKMKREIQEKIFFETEGMANEDIIKYFHQRSKRFRDSIQTTPTLLLNAHASVPRLDN